MGAKHTALVQRELPTPYSTDPNLLIGLVSRRGGGKDEVAGIISDFAVGFKRYAFADALKAELCEEGVNIGELTDAIEGVDWLEQNKATPMVRHLMQHHGTVQRKMKGNDYWLNKVVEKISTSDTKHAVISDVRYPNEFSWIKDQKGVVVKIVRDMDRNDSVDDHASERWCDYCHADYELDNNGSISDLKSNVFKMLAWADERARRIL